MEKKEIKHVAFCVGTTGKIISWNADCQRILGYAENNVLTRSLTSLLIPQAKKACQDLLRESRKEAEKLEAELVHADGRRSLFNLIFVPQFRRSGKFSGYSVIIGPPEGNIAMPEAEIIGRTPLKEMVNFLAGTFYVINQSGHFVMWNKRVEQVTQMTHAELKVVHVLDLFPEEEKKAVSDKISEVFVQDDEVLVEANLLSKKGTAMPLLFSGSRFKSHDKLYLCGMGIDISERLERQQQLRLRERALHASSTGIVITRCAGKMNPIEYVNAAFERITGYLAQEAIGRELRFMASPGLDVAERAQLALAIDERREINVIFRNLRKNGEVFWNDLTITPVENEKGVVTHFIGVLVDITALKHHTSHLEHAVNHDVLTGLANRNLLWDRLEQALNIAQRNKSMVAIALIDLDNFKIINDTMGHDAGDAVLKIVAQRLQASVRDSDTVARLGGDEFVMILSNQPSLPFTWRMIDRFREDMAQAVIVDNKELTIESSIGVSVFPHDGASVLELIQAADVAMYHAKAAGRNDVHFFSADMKSTTDAKRQLGIDLRSAIDQDEMFLVFQPRLSLKTGKIVGAEALLRWRHPVQGVLLPASFLPDAEENGLIIPLGEWVIDHICSMLQRLKVLRFQDISVSMNVSYQEFSQKNYAALIANKLDRCSLRHETFELEIKEKHLLHNPSLTRAVLSEISQLGIKLTIDGFGVELSSLSALQKLPVNYLKMPKSAIENIRQDSTDGVLAKTMIGIGRNMHIDVIADGVETVDQMNFLELNGCDEMQGNYFSKPVCLAEYEHLLEA